MSTQTLNLTVRCAREHLGYSRKSMAGILGFNGTSAHSRLAEMEKGKRSISLRVARGLWVMLKGYVPGHAPEPDLARLRAHYDAHHAGHCTFIPKLPRETVIARLEDFIILQTEADK